MPVDARAEGDGEAAGAARGEVHRALLDVLGGGGAFFFRGLVDGVARHGRVRDESAIAEALWDLAFDGLVSSDTLAPLRARISRRADDPPRAGGDAPGPAALAVGTGAALVAAASPARPAAAGVRAAPVRPGTLPTVVGRWSRVPGRRRPIRRCGCTRPPRCCSTGTASSPAAR